jgi:hypothetical protein
VKLCHLKQIAVSAVLVTEDTVTSLCYLSVEVKGMGSKVVSLFQYKYSLYIEVAVSFKVNN